MSVVSGGARHSGAPLRLTRRGRAVFGSAAAVLVLCTLWGGKAVADGRAEPVEVRVHTVSAGETVWGYATRLADVGEDVRDVVAQIVDLNEMESADLRVGQRIVLPVD